MPGYSEGNKSKMRNWRSESGQSVQSIYQGLKNCIWNRTILGWPLLHFDSIFIFFYLATSIQGSKLIYSGVSWILSKRQYSFNCMLFKTPFLKQCETSHKSHKACHCFFPPTHKYSADTRSSLLIFLRGTKIISKTCNYTINWGAVNPL